MKKKSAYQRFMALSDKAKTSEVAKFDREFTFEQATPLSADQKRLWKKAKSRTGRTKVGEGVKVISLSVEKQLLRRADAKAKADGISRAQLFARGLKAVLS